LLDHQFYSDSTRVARGRPAAIQAIIFDLDGVLVDSEWLWFLAWRELVERHGAFLDEAAFPEMVGADAEQTTAIVMRYSGRTFDPQTSSDLVAARVAQQLKDGISPLPGAHELVHALAARGLPLAIASNSPTTFVDDALRGLHLFSYFPVRIGVDQVVRGKPAPDVYLRAAEQTGIQPEHCLAFEDSRVGVQAAAAANMRVVAVPGARDSREGFEAAWRMFPSLAQAREDLDEILA
jgi:HAD superfamily hydrolase (TIGR01509 family)